MKLLSPAKINLFLQVTGRRPDGYHELFTLMCPVDLYDRLELDFDTEGISVSCSHPDVPEDDTNLACRAARVFFDHFADAPRRLRVFLEKNIPVAAGLGGGSGNAAAVLTGLNRRFGYPFSEERLRSIGLVIGADVPFFIYGKPALARGIGDKIAPCPDLPDFKVVLIYPGISVSTARVYKNLNLRLTNCEKKLKNAIFKNRGFDFKDHLCNDLEAITASWHPEIAEAKEFLARNGADGVLMSGSGPTVFGVFGDPETARKAAERSAENKRWKVFLVNPILH